MIRGPRPCRIVFDGQSRLAIPPWNGLLLGYSWGRLVTAGLGLPAVSRAISGQGWTELSTTFATRVAPYITPAEPTIFVMCGGGSDILEDGDEPEQVYADAGAYAQMARDVGAAYVLATTIMPGRLFQEDESGDAEERRQATNALMLADADGYFDAVVNLDVPGLTDTDDFDVYYDGTHVYGPGVFEFDGKVGKGLGTTRVAAVVRPHLLAAIEAVTS